MPARRKPTRDKSPIVRVTVTLTAEVLDTPAADHPEILQEH